MIIQPSFRFLKKLSFILQQRKKIVNLDK